MSSKASTPVPADAFAKAKPMGANASGTARAYYPDVPKTVMADPGILNRPHPDGAQDGGAYSFGQSSGAATAPASANMLNPTGIFSAIPGLGNFDAAAGPPNLPAKPPVSAASGPGASGTDRAGLPSKPSGIVEPGTAPVAAGQKRAGAPPEAENASASAASAASAASLQASVKDAKDEYDPKLSSEPPSKKAKVMSPIPTNAPPSTTIQGSTIAPIAPSIEIGKPASSPAVGLPTANVTPATASTSSSAGAATSASGTASTSASATTQAASVDDAGVAEKTAPVESKKRGRPKKTAGAKKEKKKKPAAPAGRTQRKTRSQGKAE